MSNGHLYAEIAGRVQFGPVYRCFICGEPVGRLVPFHEWVPGPTALDRYADHIAYLDLVFECKRQRHPARVAVIGPAIVPVDWPKEAATAEKLAAVRDAMTLLRRALEERGHDGEFDELLVLALRLHGRAIAPAQGAEEIRALAGTRVAFAT